jgi:multiple sugar transport system permease protein
VLRGLVLRHLPAALLAALFLLPLLVMVSGSLRPAGLPPPQGVEVIASSPTLDSYRRLPELVPLWTWLRNSTVVVALAVPITVLVASWAAFGMRLLPARLRRTAVLITLAVLLVPVTAVWTTRFAVFDAVSLVDTYGPLIAPAFAATTPFYVLVYLWSFTGLPESHLEAARLEGASSWRLWRAIAMPQARLATLAVAVLAFAVHWANFIDALLYIDSQSLYTLPLGLRLLQLLNPTDFPLLMAAAVIATVPPVAVFLLAQRLFYDDPLRSLRGGRT